MTWEENESGNGNKPCQNLVGCLGQYWLSQNFECEKLRLSNVTHTFCSWTTVITVITQNGSDYTFLEFNSCVICQRKIESL